MANEKDDEIVAGKKSYPAQPSMWDRTKEAFEPTAQRILIEQIRKRRAQAAGR